MALSSFGLWNAAERSSRRSAATVARGRHDPPVPERGVFGVLRDLVRGDIHCLYPPVQCRRIKRVHLAASPQCEILKVLKTQHTITVRCLSRSSATAEHEHFPVTGGLRAFSPRRGPGRCRSRPRALDVGFRPQEALTAMRRLISSEDLLARCLTAHGGPERQLLHPSARVGFDQNRRLGSY